MKIWLKKTLFKRIALAGLACLAAFGIGAGTASAGPGDALDFQRLPYEPFSGWIRVYKKSTPTSSDKQYLAHVNVRPAIDQAWSLVRDPLAQRLKQELGRGGRLNGQTAHDISLSLASRGHLEARVDANEVSIRYVLRGNRLKFSVTTPDIAFGIGLGSYADPSFVIDFDLIVTLDMAKYTPPSVGSARVEVKAYPPRGDNLTGDIAVGVNDFIKFLTGRDFMGEAMQKINSQKVDVAGQVNAALAKLSSFLPKTTADAYVDASYDKSKHRVFLTVVEKPDVPK